MRWAHRLAVLVALAAAAPSSRACDCTAMGLAFQAEDFDAPDRFLALVAGHEVVFAGTVTATDGPDDQMLGTTRYTLRVERSWTGTPGAEVVMTDAHGNCSYTSGFVTGLDVLVFGRRAPDGEIVAAMCQTARPVVLGHVTEAWTAGYAIYGPVLGLTGDLFARLDAAADRARAAFPTPGSYEIVGPETALTVVLSDALTGAPIDDAEVVVHNGWGGLILPPPPPGGAPGDGAYHQQTLRPEGLGHHGRLAPGIYAVSAQAGQRVGRVAILATGGERLVSLALRPPAE